MVTEFQINKILLIGVGNPYRNDDRAGLEVVHKLKEKNLPGVEIAESIGEGTALVEIWKERKIVILVDAVHSGARVGTVHRFHANTQSIPSQFFRYSTHAFSVAEAIELARSLRQLPSALVVYGIEGKDFNSGTKLSKQVEKAVENLVNHIEREILSLTSPERYSKSSERPLRN